MKRARYIEVVGWDQHQAKKTPNWIRVHAKDLLHDDAWLGLSPVDRSLLLGIWMLTSQAGNGRVSGEIPKLNHHLGGTSYRDKNLEALNHAGFIRLRSKRAPTQVGAGSPLEQNRTEKSTDRGTQTSTTSRADPSKKTEEPRDPVGDLIPIAAIASESLNGAGSRIAGELGHNLDRLLRRCPDRDQGTAAVFDKLAQRGHLAAGDVVDILNAIVAIKPDSPVRYATTLLKEKAH